MSILSWNCCGLGTPWTIQFLKEIVLRKKPNFVFLCEILCKKDRVERLKVSLGFEGMISVDSEGRSGGLALLWRHQDEVTLSSYSQNHIDVMVHIRNNVEYRLTGVYGEPNRARRSTTWNLLKNLASSNSLSWCVLGDLNNILS